MAAGRLTLTVVREDIERVFRERSATDPQLFLLSGLDLYGPGDAGTHPLPDALTPRRRHAPADRERFAATVFGVGTGAGGVFGGPAARR